MKIIIKSFHVFLSITLPFVILMFSVVILFKPWFLVFEYRKANFPPDPYGFSIEERLDYGIQSVQYIVNNRSDDFLANITFKNSNTPIYKSQEISHMSDVKNVYRTARLIWEALLILYLILFLVSWKHPAQLLSFLKHFIIGNLFSILFLVAVLLLVVLAFDPLFEAFHSLFFKEGSWLFYQDDTLIRLFPEKLWVDAFLIAGGLSFIFSVAFFFIGRNAYRRISINSRNGRPL